MSQIAAHLKRLINAGMFVNCPAVPKAATLCARINQITMQSRSLFNGLDSVTKNRFETMAREKRLTQAGDWKRRAVSISRSRFAARGAQRKAKDISAHPGVEGSEKD